MDLSTGLGVDGAGIDHQHPLGRPGEYPVRRQHRRPHRLGRGQGEEDDVAPLRKGPGARHWVGALLHGGRHARGVEVEDVELAVRRQHVIGEMPAHLAEPDEAQPSQLFVFHDLRAFVLLRV